MKLTALVLLALPGLAFAQPKDKPPAPPPPPPKKDEAKPIPPPAATPSKDLDSLKAWAKTWSCSGNNAAGEKVAPKLTLKRELDNFAYSVKIEVPKGKASPGF